MLLFIYFNSLLISTNTNIDYIILKNIIVKNIIVKRYYLHHINILSKNTNFIKIN